MMGDIEDDARENFIAMLQTKMWHHHMLHLKKDIDSLKNVLLNNETLSSEKHFASVLQLRMLKQIIRETYKDVGEEVPKHYLSWFE